MNKVIVFDIDDTLVKTSLQAFYKHNWICKKLGKKQTTKEEYFRYFGKISFEEMVKILLPDIEIDLYRKYYLEAQKDFPYLPILENTNALIKEILTRGFNFGILTNGNNIKTNKKISVLNLQQEVLKQILFIITGNDLGENKKPSPKAFDKVKEKIGENSEIMYVGDSLEDYYSARGAGVEFYGVLTGFTKKEEFLQNGLEENKILNSVNDIITKI